MSWIFKRFLSIFFLAFIGIEASAQDRGFNVIHYDLSFDFLDFSAAQLKGNALLEIEVDQNSIDSIHLDLLKLSVDSVLLEGFPLSFNHNDTILSIALSQSANVGDTLILNIHYGGVPHAEAASFGGFFFRSGMAYNVGVAFREYPHNYGRVWFPCLDNLTDRASYDIHVLMEGGRRSTCSGLLQLRDSLGGDTIIEHWSMSESIPTYLASMAVGIYDSTSYQYIGLERTIPIDVYTAPSKTASLAGSFANLRSCMRIYEEGYAPYAWERCGYVVLPMTGGAMEHANNIAYPSFAINGNTSRETLMAHELSHHWWGNLVTCERQEEMWLNEGWASFSEWLFLEKQYDWASAQVDVEARLHDLLKNLHHDEGGYRDLVSIPQEITYGSHVYDKGALTALALREYMGPSLFTAGIDSFLSNNQFASINSEYLRNELEKYTPIDLHSFFDEWVFSPGWASVSLDSFRFSPTTGLTDVYFELSQQYKGRDFNSKLLPLSITVLDSQFVTQDFSVELSSLSDTFHLSSVISQPAAVFVNRQSRLPLAISSGEMVIKSPGSYSFSNADVSLKVNSLGDSALVRIEEHWTPVPMLVSDMSRLKVRPNPDRFWSIQGIALGGMSAEMSFVYNGLPSSRLDESLSSVPEDSLVLLHRSYGQKSWTIYQNASLNTSGNSSDGLGAFVLTEVAFGDYAFGIRDVAAGAHDVQEKLTRAYPNPCHDRLYIENYEELESLTLTNVLGQEVSIPEMNFGILRMEKLSPGMYILRMKVGGQQFEERIVKR